MDVDWRATFQQNFWEDFHQTVYFSRTGVEELNPVYREMVRKKDYTLLAAGWLSEYLLTDALTRSSPQVYQTLGAWRLILVGLNARKHGVGIPVLVVRF